MKCLSIRQPFAWAILHAGKRVENRVWKPPQSMIGKRFLIHAAKECTGEEFNAAIDWMVRERVVTNALAPALIAQTWRGGIVGCATLTGFHCPGEKQDPWHMPEQYGFILEDVQELPFTPLRGMLGFFEVPDELVQKLGVQA